MKTNQLILLLSILFRSFAVADDETDFSAEPPPSWIRANPLVIGSYDYTGGKLRLMNPAPPIEIAQAAGFGRVQLFAPTIFTQCVASVDVVAWSGSRNFASVGLLLSNMGLGTTTGYSFTLVPGDGDVEIHRLDGEVPTLISQSGGIAVQPGHTYRLVFAAVDGVLTGRVYDHANLTTSLIEVSALDSTYTEGVTAIGVSTDTLDPIDVTFDNFLAWDGTPPPLSIAMDSGFLVLSANGPRSLAGNIQITNSLDSLWGPANAFGASVGSTMSRFYPITGDSAFFRMKLMGAP